MHQQLADGDDVVLVGAGEFREVADDGNIQQQVAALVKHGRRRGGGHHLRAGSHVVDAVDIGRRRILGVIEVAKRFQRHQRALVAHGQHRAREGLVGDELVHRLEGFGEARVLVRGFVLQFHIKRGTLQARANGGDAGNGNRQPAGNGDLPEDRPHPGAFAGIGYREGAQV